MTEVVTERARAGVGVVFSSHQLELVEDICEDVVIIARGRIVAAGTIDELKERNVWVYGAAGEVNVLDALALCAGSLVGARLGARMLAGADR